MNKTIGTFLAAAAGVAALAIPAHADSLRWSGQVDDRATIYIHRNDVRVESNLQGVRNEKHDLRGQLPQQDVRVRLDSQDGRGRVRLIQQPSSKNNYTAAVRIEDSEAGRGRYSFTLDWDQPSRGRGGRSDRDRPGPSQDRPGWGRGR